MFFRATWFSSVLVLLLCHGFAWGQDKAPALTGPDLKTAQEEVRKQSWFPKETRDPLGQVTGSLSLLERARTNTEPTEAYATLVEAITWSDSAIEWHLSRDILREIESRFSLPPDLIRQWYLKSIRKTEHGARLAELADLFAAEILDEKFAGIAKDWEPIHRLLTNRLEESKNSATLFSCRQRMQLAHDRLELRQKDQSSLWQGVTSIVQSQDIEAGIKLLSNATQKEVAKPAAEWTNNGFAYENGKKLLTSLVEFDNPSTREAAILIFESILEKLTNEQIRELQDVCYSLSHELANDFSLPYYDHRQNPGQEVRLDILRMKRGEQNVRFRKNEKAWEVKDECWFEYIQMPLTSSVHDIEFTATKIPGFFKFRYGAYNSLRVGFEPVGKDRFRLKHQHSYGTHPSSRTSKDTFAYGDRIKLTVYTLVGRQFVVINGKYMTERTLDNVWTSHQFVCEGGTKLKLYKSTLRNWLVGDLEILRRTFRYHSSMRCVGKASTDWNRDELIRYTRENSSHGRKSIGPDKSFVNQLGIVMMPISAGEYKQGKMTIKLTKPFWVSQHEITQLQWEQITGSNPASIQGNAHFPVDNLSYSEAIKFCQRLNAFAKKKRQLPTGYAYRLLTDAEWEYVCRAGETDSFSVENDGFWHREVSEPRYHAVGSSSPNPFGIYDMHGNVEEFTLDQYVRRSSDAEGVEIDPMNPPNEPDDHISIRGGSWCNLAEDCTSEKRKTGLMERCPYRGLRVALAPVKK